MAPLDGWLEVARGRVGPEHIDYNGHMNVVHYRAAFDASTDGLFAHLGLGPEEYNARTGATLMVVEEHTRYHAELSEGERYRVLARLVGHSAKKLHYLLAMENLDKGVLAATHEELALHVDLTARRSSPLPPPALKTIEALEATQAQLPPPPDLGRVITP
jgi:acyl-CoA thioester hydrolase